MGDFSAGGGADGGKIGFFVVVGALWCGFRCFVLHVFEVLRIADFGVVFAATASRARGCWSGGARGFDRLVGGGGAAVCFALEVLDGEIVHLAAHALDGLFF